MGCEELVVLIVVVGQLWGAWWVFVLKRGMSVMWQVRSSVARLLRNLNAGRQSATTSKSIDWYRYYRCWLPAQN